ncbi:MAG: flagellar assembly protein FliX [Rickettsiaceae bacterium]|nr:flagellar assembly protein FliX [Rickettsiaceae bacterium]
MTIIGILHNEAGKVNNRKIESKVNRAGDFKIKDVFEEADSISSQDSSVSETASMRSVNPFLILNEFDAAESEAQILRNKGRRIITSLRGILISLLSGSVSEEDLERLKNAIEDAEEDFADPELNILYNEIKIRAEVEIAKLEKCQE